MRDKKITGSIMFNNLRLLLLLPNGAELTKFLSLYGSGILNQYGVLRVDKRFSY